MYKLCVFAGTADGRQLVERLAGQAEILACAATEYGGELLEEIPGVEVSAQRLDENQMEELFRQRQFDCVIDATHPYAPIVTENIRSACEKTDTSYLRLLRDGGLPEGCLFADSTAQAVEMLKTLPGNILLTTGSKELAAYAALPDYASGSMPRVLPVEASVAACRRRAARRPYLCGPGAVPGGAERCHAPRLQCPNSRDQADRQQGRLL